MLDLINITAYITHCILKCRLSPWLETLHAVTPTRSLGHASPHIRNILHTDIDLLVLPCSSVTISHQSISVECDQSPHTHTHTLWDPLTDPCLSCPLRCVYFEADVYCVCRLCVTQRESVRRPVPCRVRHARKSATQWLGIHGVFVCTGWTAGKLGVVSLVLFSCVDTNK